MTLQRADDDIDADIKADGAPPAELLPLQETDDAQPRRARRRLTRRARWLLIGALVLLLAGGGVGAWALFFRTTTPTTTYRAVTVASETLKQTVSGAGTLNPATQSNLSFASSGTVTSVDVEPGDLVHKGEKLAAIDDTELKIDYESAKASRTEAEESLTTLEDNDDSTAAAITAAKATVKVKKLTVTQAKTALDDATMVSPIAGKVAAVTVAKGDTVSGGSSTSGSSTGTSGTSGGTGAGTGNGAGTGTGTTSGTGAGSGTIAGSSSSTAAITVISNGTFTVTTSVSNADVTSIKKGLQATITPTSATNPVFGTVSTVGVVASTSTTSAASAGSATFPVTIKVTGVHKELLPGSSATVAITVKQLSNVISLPTQAVTTVNGKTVVQKLVNGRQVRTDVTLGASVGAATVITKGLSVGDQVVVASFRATGAGESGTGTRGGTGGYPVGTGGYPGGSGGFPAGGFPGQRQGQGQGQGQGTQGGTR